MPNPRLAGRYAKSLVDLAIEKGQLEEVYNDMLFIQAVCKASKGFVTLLCSPIIKADKKEAIIKAVTQGKVSDLTIVFYKLLLTKGRESDLPEITGSVIDLYNQTNGIQEVKLTTAVAVGDDLKKDIIAKLKAEAGLNRVELETKVDESLIGGFVLEFNNNLVDTSIQNELREVRKQFSKNLYVKNIR